LVSRCGIEETVSSISSMWGYFVWEKKQEDNTAVAVFNVAKDGRVEAGPCAVRLGFWRLRIETSEPWQDAKGLLEKKQHKAGGL
jgi:hypothetical protein